MAEATVQFKVKPWTPEPARDLVLVNASIVDVKLGCIVPDSSIRISHGVITEIYRSGSRTEADCNRSSDSSDGNSKALVVDLHGQYVMPGLIDCHVHLTGPPGKLAMTEIWDDQPTGMAYRTAYAAKQMLLRGFTTVRDAGGADTSLRNAIQEGLIPGPRVFMAGKALSQTGGHGDFRRADQDDRFKCCSGSDPFLARIADGVPECLRATRDELRKGADFIKIMTGGGVATLTDPLDMLQFTPAEIHAIADTAANSHTYVTAHAYTSEAIRHAVDNGVRGIEHGNFVDLETARYCAEKGVVFTPTLVCYTAMMATPGMLSPASIVKTKAVLAKGLEALRILSEAGATICYGTDLLGSVGPWQTEELRIRSQVLGGLDVLQSATLNAAKLLKMEGRLGCVQGGAVADLLILDRNPLEDVEVLNTLQQDKYALKGIIKDGRVVTSKVEGLPQDPHYRQ
ncbi:hypothetical protein KEM52_001708 [Ascosphaera acerosa]|nr:hypothetical protein KEM52_001708 [Ascosphaera acerosa]